VSDQFGDHQSYSHEGIWPSLNRFLVLLIILSALIPIGYAFMPEVKKRRQAEARIEELREQIETENLLLTRLQREEQLLQRDPEYTGLIARDKLNLMAPGEFVLRLDPPKPGK
jgi:cell division protein FtsB